ncbi:MAG TPA: glycosyltransferase [Acetobacteraceae bacterium]|nr:glycosyltransferase [Acetobacteraceae bacterium]
MDLPEAYLIRQPLPEPYGAEGQASNGPGIVGRVPDRARGRWCIVSARARRGDHNTLVGVSFADADGVQQGLQYCLGLKRRRGVPCYRTVAYVPREARSHRIRLLAPFPFGAEPELEYAPISRPSAALRVVAAGERSWQSLPRLRLSGNIRRIRSLLAKQAWSQNRPTRYDLWIKLFDSWPPPPSAEASGRIAALVFHRDPGAPGPLGATLASLAAQDGGAVPCRVLAGENSAHWPAAVAELPGEYIAILQAGELLPGHAVWFASAELRRLGDPAIAFADQDAIGIDGARAEPEFRPRPNHTLMLSGTQSRGVWFVHRDILLGYAEMQDPGWAERLRLEVWLRSQEAGGADSYRLPVILSHRRADAEAAPADVLAACVNGHLDRTGSALQAAPSFPLRVRAQAAAKTRKVSIVIPSTLRRATVRRCLHSMLERTDHAAFDVTIGVCQPHSLGREQLAVAARLEADPRVRVLHVPMPTFNFARACNALIAATDAETILVANDDLFVLSGGWLTELVAHLSDPRVAVVGAKLLYPDQTVQHGGVVMGLGGLCDHAYRHAPRHAPGYSGRAALAQEMSAVTGACLLVRRAVYDALHGLDERYPSAFNDVDFCLRVREAGYAVVFAPAAELIHHEGLTYGSHYGGARAADERSEVARLRARWGGVMAADPFHSPNLDLTISGWEWSLAFPPRRPCPGDASD